MGVLLVEARIRWGGLDMGVVRGELLDLGTVLQLGLWLAVGHVVGELVWLLFLAGCHLGDGGVESGLLGCGCWLECWLDPVEIFFLFLFLLGLGLREVFSRRWISSQKIEQPTTVLHTLHSVVLDG